MDIESHAQAVTVHIKENTMKPEFKLVREIAFLLLNTFVLAFIFDFMNAKNTALVIVGLIGLAIVFLIDCAYIRKVIIPMVKPFAKEVLDHEIK